MKTLFFVTMLGIGIMPGHPPAQAGEDIEGNHMMMEGSHSVLYPAGRTNTGL